MDDGSNKILKGVGGGCGACGCLMLLSATVLAILVAVGAFNYSAEGQALGGAASSACCGSLALLLGIVLFVVGRRKAASAGSQG